MIKSAILICLIALALIAAIVGAFLIQASWIWENFCEPMESGVACVRQWQTTIAAVTALIIGSASISILFKQTNELKRQHRTLRKSMRISSLTRKSEVERRSLTILSELDLPYKRIITNAGAAIGQKSTNRAARLAEVCREFSETTLKEIQPDLDDLADAGLFAASKELNKCTARLQMTAVYYQTPGTDYYRDQDSLDAAFTRFKDSFDRIETEIKRIQEDYRV